MIKKDIEETPEETPEEEVEETTETPEETPEETPAEETPESTEEATEKAAEEVAKVISKHLGLDELKKTIAQLNSKSGLKQKLFGAQDVMRQDVSKMTKEEKIVGFFGALLRNDSIGLKALSEGVAADLNNPQVSFSA